jgi:iron complex transport system ATP-binding protein
MPLKIDNYSNNILKNITFSLKEKEHLIILGSNGVGKTTLAKVLCGITPSSNVFLNNISLSKIYGHKRAKLINYIPPKLDVFDEFISVYEFLELGLLEANEAKKNSIGIDDILKTLNIIHLRDKACKSLSSGESQLLLVASALLHSANYTIFDEPTANLDPQKMQLLFNILKNNSLLKSKIIITHNLDLAYKLGYNILFLENGAIKFHGLSSNFFSQEYLNKLYGGSVQKTKENIVVKL